MDNLSHKEKRLLKVLGTILVLSGIFLYFVLQPTEIKTVTGTKTTTEVPEEQSVSSSRPSSRPSSRGSGGSRGSSSSSANQDTPGASISTGQFEQNNTKESCWVLIEGVVYDITEYLSTLRDTEEIVQYCGTFGFKEGYLNDSDLSAEAIIQEATIKGAIK